MEQKLCYLILTLILNYFIGYYLYTYYDDYKSYPQIELHNLIIFMVDSKVHSE